MGIRSGTMDITQTVKEYRKKIIEGKCIDLVPVKKEHLSRIIELRNQDKSRYFLNQPQLLTLEMQKEWFDKYSARTNDIYWCIRNKEGVIVGTIRLYDITEESCSHGSFIIDETYTLGNPYALEAQIITLEFAFRELKVRKVINDNRIDNEKVCAISQKMGFHFEKEIEIHNIKYLHYVLDEKDLNTDKYKTILERFMKRRS